MSSISTVEDLMQYVKEVFSIDCEDTEYLKGAIEAFFYYAVPEGTNLTEETVWLYREAIRDMLVYEPPHFLLEHVGEKAIEHKLSVSESNERFISYFPSKDDVIRDRRVRMKPGRYLAKFTDLDNDKIRELVATYRHLYEPPELEIFTTAKDILKVYANGPNSCMKKPWGANKHPVLVYGYSPQLGIAAIRKKGSKDSYAARCVVNVEKNIYGRIYGDSTLLSKLLEREGFRKSDPNEHDMYEDVYIPLIRVMVDDYPYVAMPYFDTMGSKRLLYIYKPGWAKFTLQEDAPCIDACEEAEVCTVQIPLSRTEGQIIISNDPPVDDYLKPLNWFSEKSLAELKESTESEYTTTTEVGHHDESRAAEYSLSA